MGFGLTLLPAAALAEDQPASKPADQQDKPKKEKHRNTPLDTIMQTRIWADVPESKDFVKQHRPDREKLEFQPVIGTDPERPKLRTPAELKDLETELEGARLKADKKGGIKPSPASTPPAKQRPATASQ